LLDLKLPGMDGWEFRAQQRQDPALASIPVVVISGTCDVAQAADALAAAGYLQKPVEVERLLDQVRQVTHAPRTAVLVVEDEPGVLRMLGLALRHAGFTVRLASSGAEAVWLYEQEGNCIDVVLLDVQMPGLDGPQTLARLRQLNPNVHALFMSGYTGKYTPEELLALGASRVLAKPFRSLTDLALAVWETAHPK
jgi:CheY-like chemotaxis protein